MTTPAEQAGAQAAMISRTSPYQGLVPYGQDDEEWFFGRQGAREVVLDSLRAYRVTVLYGESGVGKSSLLRGSVLPHLSREAESNLEADGTPESLTIVFAEWSGHDPLRALKQAVYDAASKPPAALRAEALEAQLAELLSMCAECVGGIVFVILDQLEELFLYHGTDPAGRAFEDELVGAVRRRDVAANFLLSIREDALAKLDRLQSRVPDLLDNLVRLEHLDERGAREAIERPLAHWNSLTSTNISIEPALVEQLLVEVQTGMLLAPGIGGAGYVSSIDVAARRIEAPYLQLVLLRIWREERAALSDVMRLETLERLGGAERIVRTHLDDVLDKLSRRDRRAAAIALRYLVTPSGTKIALRMPDLIAYTGVPVDRLERVLAVLGGEARILRPVADGAYEIYHDVLAAAVLDWRRRYEERRDRSLLARAVALAIAAVVIAIVFVAYEGNVFGGLENDTLDARFSIRGPERPPANVVIVGIDNATFRHLNQQWPFPRSLDAQVLNRLAKDGARVIAYDIQFPAPSVGGQKDDIAFLNAIKNAQGKTVFSAAAIARNGQVMFLGSNQGTRLLSDVGSRPASSLFPEDAGSVIRRLPYSTNGLQSFAVATAELATNRRVTSAEFPGTSTAIDYLGGRGTTPEIPFWKVYQRRFAPGAFRGKVVVVGATAPLLQDIHPTSVGSMSGPEIQANAIDTILRGYPLHTRTVIDFALIALLAVLVALASLRLGSLVLVATALGLGVLYLIAAQIAFDNGVLLSVTYPLLALVLVTLGVLGWRSLRRSSRVYQTSI
ncbi:MAG TPA: CHASE2 domain-containing protein [Galbitalea sp.]|jgi:CHASE2 domain-containing sensor protein